MKARIDRSTVSGSVRAPASKSYTIRALVCAGLARGGSLIRSPLDAEDTQAARNVLRGLGVTIDDTDSGRWRVTGGKLMASDAPLYCGDSAATLRFMTAVCAGVPGVHCLEPSPALARRPIQPLLDTMNRLGVDCHVESGVIVINGGQASGGLLSVSGDVSSQFISALLLLAPLLKKGLTLELTSPPVSRPYLEMTLECLHAFGVEAVASPDWHRFEVRHQDYCPADYLVESDWSSASYLLALGALSGEVCALGLNSESFQADRIVLQCLEQMGASVNDAPDGIAVRRSPLHGLEFNLAESIDLLPTLAVLAAAASSRSVLSGISRARLKESNRVAALREGLERMGVEAAEMEDTLIIGDGQPHGANIDSYGDHRIAMAFAILGTHTGNMIIEGAECVAKTYPDFWQTLEGLGVRIELLDG